MAVPASAVRNARAWLFEAAHGVWLAAGAPFVVEYLLEPETIPLPCTPAHCRGVMLWRERMIPVVDLMAVLPGPAPARTRAVVLAWQDAPGKLLRHGALALGAAPVEVFVDDGMACALPDEPAVLRNFANSCFELDGRAIAIIDVVRLFARPLEYVPESSENRSMPRPTTDEPRNQVSIGFVPASSPAMPESPPVQACVDTAGLTVTPPEASPSDAEAAMLDVADAAQRAAGSCETRYPIDTTVLLKGEIAPIAGKTVVAAPEPAVPVGNPEPSVTPNPGLFELLTTPEFRPEPSFPQGGVTEIVLDSPPVVSDPAPGIISGEPATVTLREALTRHIVQASGGRAVARRRRTRRKSLLVALAAVLAAAAIWVIGLRVPNEATVGGGASGTQTEKTIATHSDITPKAVGTMSIPIAPARPPE